MASSASKRQTRQTAQVARGMALVRADVYTVYVADGLNPQGEALVKAFAKAGFRVAFGVGTPGYYDDGEKMKGRQLSQATGTRFYPSHTVPEALADLTDACGGVDALVIDDCQREVAVDLPIFKRVFTISLPKMTVTCKSPHGSLTVEFVENDIDGVAEICLLMCLSASQRLMTKG